MPCILDRGMFTMKLMPKSVSGEILLVFTLLTVLTCLFFHEIVLHPDKMVYSEHSDIVGYHYPLKLYQTEFVREHGRFPKWYPTSFSGYTLIGNMQAQTYYPPNLLFVLLPVEAAFGYYYMLHMLLLGFFTFLYVRSLGVSGGGSLVSALTLMFGGYVTAGLVYPGITTIMATMVWVPAALLCAEKGVRTREIRYFVFLGVVVGLQFLSGYIQTSIMTAMLLFPYVLYRSYLIQQNIRYVAGLTAGAFVLGALIASIQLLPALEASRESTRYGVSDYGFSTQYSYPPEHLITLLIPEFFGSPKHGTFWGDFRSWDQNFWSYCTYVGVLPLILAIFAVLCRRDKTIPFFALTASVSLLLAMGKYAPFYRILYLLPGFAMLRAPSRFLLLTVLSLSVLAGYGADYIAKPDRVRERRRECAVRRTVYVVIFSICLLAIGLISAHFKVLPFAEKYHSYEVVKYSSAFPFLLCLGVLIILLQFSGKISGRQFMALACLFVVFDLWVFGLKYVDVKDPEDIYPFNPIVARLNKDPGKFRVLSLGEYEGVLPQALASAYNLETVTGYDQIQSRRYRDFMSLIGGFKHQPSGQMPVEKVFRPDLLSLLNVKYVLSEKLFYERWCRPLGIGHGRKGGQVFVCQNTRQLPRAFLVSDFMAVVDSDDAYSTLEEGGLDLRRYVVLEGDIRKGRVPTQSSKKDVDIVYYLPERMIVRVKTDEPAHLILSETWAPGWRAYDNGVETEIYPAYLTLRSVYLKEGEHVVEIVYKPRSLRIGGWITGLTLIGLASYLFASFLRRRRATTQTGVSDSLGEKSRP